MPGFAASRLKKIQYVLIALGFLLLISSAIIFKAREFSLNIAGTRFEARQLAILAITLAVGFYFSGQMLGFIDKYSRRRHD